MNEETNEDEITDSEYDDMQIQVLYQQLLDDPTALEALVDKLGIKGEEMLTQEQVWEEATRLQHQDSSTDDQD